MLQDLIATPGSMIAISGSDSDVNEFIAILSMMHAGGFSIEGKRLESRIGIVNFLFDPYAYLECCHQFSIKHGWDWQAMHPECVTVRPEALSNPGEFIFLAEQLKECEHLVVLDYRFEEDLYAKLYWTKRYLMLNGNCRIICLLDDKEMESQGHFRDFDLNMQLVRNKDSNITYTEVRRKKNSKIYWPQTYNRYSPKLRDDYL